MNQKDLINSVNSNASDELNKIIIDAIQDVKGEEIIKFDMRGLDEASTDYFIICHANSSTQINGILSKIERQVYDFLGLRPNHIEGQQGKSWMLIDYFSVVVHVFDKNKRAFYNLEELWNDAEITTYEDL